MKTKFINKASVYVLILLLLYLLLNCSNIRSYPIISQENYTTDNYKIFLDSDVLDILKKHYKIDKKFKFSVQRSTDGQKLIVLGKFNSARIVYVIEGDKLPRKLVPPGDIAYINDREQFVAWTDNLSEEINFINGSHLTLCKYCVFGVAQGGEYYFSESVPGTIDIYTIDYPINKHIFSTKFRVSKIFATTEKMYLFGYDSPSYPRNKYQDKIICKIFKYSTDEFEEEKTINIMRPRRKSSPFFVVDFDPISEVVIVEDTQDKPIYNLSYWYKFDLRSFEMVRVGKAEGNILFIKKSIFDDNN